MVSISNNRHTDILTNDDICMCVVFSGLFSECIFCEAFTTFHRRKNMYANVCQLRAFLYTYACTMEMFFVQYNRFVNKKGKYTIHILNFKSVTYYKRIRK